MNLCVVCGRNDGRTFCELCRPGGNQIEISTPSVVVDGSWIGGDRRAVGMAGAGLVLVAGEPDTGEVIDVRMCLFICRTSNDAETQAIIRAAAWMPRAWIYSDNDSAVRHCFLKLRLRVSYLPGQRRSGNHRMAHRLAYLASTRAPEYSWVEPA